MNWTGNTQNLLATGASRQTSQCEHFLTP